VTQRNLKIQLLLVKTLNPDTRVVFDPDLPPNTLIIEEEEDEDA
jgi:hypothetical protein